MSNIEDMQKSLFAEADEAVRYHQDLRINIEEWSGTHINLINGKQTACRENAPTIFWILADVLFANIRALRRLIVQIGSDPALLDSRNKLLQMYVGLIEVEVVRLRYLYTTAQMALPESAAFLRTLQRRLQRIISRSGAL